MILLNLTPTEEDRITTAARQKGLLPAEYNRSLVNQHLPPLDKTARLASQKKPKGGDSLLESWIAAAPIDPDEILADQAARDEFVQALNRNRIESGERPLIS